MSLVTRSLPGLFGGVSQQIPAMRHATHCTEQRNGFATLVDGLYKRPGTRRAATLPLTGADGLSVSGSYGAAHVHMIEKGPNELYALVLVNGNFMLYSMQTGLAVPVDCPDGRTYLQTASPSTDFRCVTVADYTFIVNTSKVTAMSASADALNPVNVGYINVRTAVPSVTYGAILDGGDTTMLTGATPNNRDIANTLANAINTTRPGYSAYVLQGTNVIKVTRTNGSPIVVGCWDGWGNQAMQALTAGVDKYSDLPARFEVNYVLQINGSAESSQDPYYVKWDGQRWVETRKPGITYSIVSTSMPHQLRKRSDGTWVFERVSTWGERKSGDNDTNPLPSFIGQAIRGVFFFRNRLGFLSGDSLVMSRAGDYFNFWATSATVVLDTDPIDLASPLENVETLDWTTPYNQSLVVWATKGKQLILTADDILSPKSARLVPTTSFEAYGGTEPAALGNRVLFASTIGSHTQVNLYRVAEDQVTNSADDVTEHVPKYVPAAPRAIVASTALKAAVVVPSGVNNELKLFKYEMDDRDKTTQRAWSTIAFDTTDTLRIMRAHWQSRKLHLVVHVESSADPVAGGRFVIETLDFEETAKDTNLTFALCLDSRVELTGGAFNGTTTSVTLPYLVPANPVFLRCDIGEEPEQLTVVSSTPNPVQGNTTFALTGNHTGAVIAAGRPYTFRYVFSEVVLRDGEGVPVMAASVKLVRYLLRYVTTGWFKAKVKPALRGTFEYVFNGRTIGQPGQGPSELALSTGTFPIPVQTRADGVEVSIESDSWLPAKFPYAEWVGDITMKANR